MEARNAPFDSKYWFHFDEYESDLQVSYDEQITIIYSDYIGEIEWRYKHLMPSKN
jgi:hypothetical protein